MTYAPDPRLIDAKDKSVREVLDLLQIYGLQESRNRQELFGPCPECGDSGHDRKSGPVDRFNINLDTGAFFCRRGCFEGGDVIALVRVVKRCSFPEALTFLCGDRPQNETPAEREAREERQREARERQEREAQARDAAQNRYRRRAIEDARRIWNKAGEGGPADVGAYLALRGIDVAELGGIPPALRFLPDHPYVKKIGGERVTAHRGPCMIAGILDPKGAIAAVHQTWLDLSAPKGKAAITWQGETLDAKMVRGSKKGGAIRLYTAPDADTLVMGEGIETTLTAMLARAYPRCAYWAGVDMDNMAGKAARVDGKRVLDRPDPSDTRAFVAPTWAGRQVYILDGDSNPKTTRPAMQRGLRRSMALRPGLQAQIVDPGKGVDLNDLAMGVAPESEGEDA